MARISKNFNLNFASFNLSNAVAFLEYCTQYKLFKQIRILIAKECENISKLQGEIEID